MSVEILKTRVIKMTIIATSVGEFRVWESGAIDFYHGHGVGDWNCLPDWISAEDEAMIRTAGLTAIKELP